MKGISAIWYSCLGTAKVIGIVKVNTGYEDKYYIGIADGEDENTDIQQVISYGSRFYPGIFLTKEKKKKDTSCHFQGLLLQMVSSNT